MEIVQRRAAGMAQSRLLWLFKNTKPTQKKPPQKNPLLEEDRLNNRKYFHF